MCLKNERETNENPRRSRAQTNTEEASQVMAEKEKKKLVCLRRSTEIKSRRWKENHVTKCDKL